MSDLFDQWRLSPSLSRVILFRVLPGHKNEVAEEIEQRCLDADLPRENFRIYRLFGSYEILFVQDECRLTAPDFAAFGSIPGITGSSEYTCYKWQNSRGPTRPSFSIDKLKEPLVGLCFLKINPQLTQKLGLSPEISFSAFLKDKMPNIQLLGTLGWSEVILFIPGKSLDDVLNSVSHDLTRLVLEHSVKNQIKKNFFAEKTLTILGYDKSVSSNQTQIEISKGVRDRKFELHFSATCMPRAMGHLQRYAAEHFKIKTEKPWADELSLCMGPRDLEFKIPLKNTLNDLITLLDKFREDNQNAIIRTHTELLYKTSTSWPAPELEQIKKVVIPLTRKEAQFLTGLGPEGVGLAETIYQFNNLVENHLLVDAYIDLTRCLAGLKRRTLDMKEMPSLLERSRLSVKLHYIQQAISQRMQGAYPSLQENSFSLTAGILPCGIAVHRLIKALQAIPSIVLSQLGKNWAGFVLLGGHRATTMEHYLDIVLVPSQNAVDPHEHWAITHECMHVFQNLDIGPMSLRHLIPSGAAHQPLKLSDSTDSTEAFVLTEAVAEILDFALCCPFPVGKYLRMTWTYFKDNIFGADETPRKLQGYILRSFAVYCYAKMDERSDDPIVELTHDRIRSEYRRFMKIIGGIVGLSQITEVDERGQTHEELILQRFINDIATYLPDIVKKVRVAKGKLAHEEPTDALKCLRSGRIVAPDKLKSPQQIAWLMSQGHISDQMALAWILSLWHLYHVRKLGIDLTKLIVE